MTIIVSGLARCGTSLTMQMLHACGLRCAGDWPAFEPDETNTLNGPLSAEWMSGFDAVKVIDPHHSVFPNMDAVVIWLDRDTIQQAKSQLKMVRMLTGFTVALGAHRAMRKSLEADRPLALRQFIGMPTLCVRFEDAVGHPRAFADRIRDFAPQLSLDTERMARCVQRRTNGPACEPGLEIESRLIDQKG